MSKIPENAFRGIIASVLCDFMENNASSESTEVSHIFLYFKREFMQFSVQFCSITNEQIEAAVHATELHKNIVVELCRRIGSYAVPVAAKDFAVACPAVVASDCSITTKVDRGLNDLCFTNYSDSFKVTSCYTIIYNLS